MKFKTAYTNGKPTYRKNKKKTPGIYLIKEDGRIKYVGYSLTDVHKTAYRHFQRWNDPAQYRATFDKYALLYILPTSKSRAAKLEKLLIEKYQPEKNTYMPEINLPDSFVIDNSPLPF
jgi:excinuclease UvrABC nuclease subunit